MRDKRGQFELRKSIYWTIIVVVITVLIMVSVGIMSSYSHKLTLVPEKLEGELIASRFWGNTDCFADEEEGRVYSQVIDWGKFNQEKMDKCYWVKEEDKRKEFGFGLRLEGAEGVFLKTNNYVYDDDFVIVKDVLVREGGKIRKDKLIIRVQVEV